MVYDYSLHLHLLFARSNLPRLPPENPPTKKFRVVFLLSRTVWRTTKGFMTTTQAPMSLVNKLHCASIPSADTSAAHARPVTTRVGDSISPAPRYTSSQYGLQLSLRHAFVLRLVCHTKFSHRNTSTSNNISRQVRRLEALRSRSGERRAWERIDQLLHFA